MIFPESQRRVFNTEAEWRAWQRARKLEQQRARRASMRRIDYYPSEAAAAVIDANVKLNAGYDYSSVISGIIKEWAETPESNRSE